MAIQIFNLQEKPHCAALCAAWNYGEWGFHYGEATLEETVQKFEDRASRQDLALPQSWVGFEGEVAAGMIGLDDEDHPDRLDLFPWVVSFFIHPHFRGRGYSAAFMNCVESAAENLGFKTLYLFTPTGENLYKKYGWTKIGQERDPAGFKPHVSLMKKDF